MLLFGLLQGSWCAAQDPTPKGVPPGFKPLFDDHSLEGWHSAPRLNVPRTADKALVAASGPTTKSAINNANGIWKVRDGVIEGGQDAQRFAHREDGAEWGYGGGHSAASVETPSLRLRHWRGAMP